MMKFKIFIVFLTLAAISFCNPLNTCSSGFHKEYSISGKTMGTYYKVLVYTKKEVAVRNLKQKIDVQLKMINQKMSLYLKSSEISKFNKADKNKAIHISLDFYKVITEAQKLYQITNGSWDGTVRPLYELWDFDRFKKLAPKTPDSEKIRSSLSKTGFNNIIIANRTLTKQISGISLDLGSIAKGFGVDTVVLLLKDLGLKNFFVEIGGEVYVAGHKTRYKKWKVGISLPKHSYSDKPYKILTLSDKALATSGTYRNFFEINSKTYSHIINPKTGWPVDNNIVSVSVLADNCMLADGLATGLMVMGSQKGIELINSLKNIESMIVIKGKDKKLKPFFSQGFSKYLN